MKEILMLIAVLACTITGQHITLSKDSLWVYNNSRSGRYGDSLTIVNNGSQAVRLDSARLRFSEWHTANPSFVAANAQAMMTEFSNGTRATYYFMIDSIDGTEYRLDFSAISGPLFSVGPSGGSTVLGNLQIGGNFFGDMPVYPKYLKGVLQLFFSNGETVGIDFYSDDLRPTMVNKVIQVRRHAAAGGNGAHYLINGRKIPAKLHTTNRWRIRHRTYEIRSIE